MYNIVSLGCFCSAAMELERIGLRNCSLPFDWVISGNLNLMLDLIENNFIGFAEKENYLEQRVYMILDWRWRINWRHLRRG